MKRVPVFACVLLVSFGVHVTEAAAQATEGDTLPFRKGQWAVEFPIQSDIGFGFLHFLSRRSALLLDATAEIERSSSRRTDLPGQEDGTFEEQEGTIRIGYRRYRAIGSRVAALTSVGVSSGWHIENDFRRVYAGVFEESERETSWGGFAELGGAYFVNSRFGLGMRTGIGGSYRVSRIRRQVGTDPAENSHARGYTIALAQTTIFAAIFF